jgi:hypothetical protein
MTPRAALPGARWNPTIAVLPLDSSRVCWVPKSLMTYGYMAPVLANLIRSDSVLLALRTFR